MNPGSRREHDKFCRAEAWSEVTNARGGKVRHHVTYELQLPDGRTLRTRISRPVNTDTYGASLWKHVLSEQLDVSEDEFWACVRDGVRPDRGGPVAPPPDALPAQLVWQLIHDVGVPEDEVAELSLDEAVARMRQHWSESSGQRGIT